MPGKPWLRWYRGTCSDTKFRMIGLEYDMPTVAVVGAWAAVLECVTDDYGTVTLADRNCSQEQLCMYLQASLGMSESDATDVVGGFIWQQILRAEGESLVVPKWQKHQTFDTTAAERMRRHRAKKSDGPGDGPVTESLQPSYGITKSKSESYKKKEDSKKESSTAVAVCSPTKGVHVCSPDFKPAEATLHALKAEGFSDSEIRRAAVEMVDWSRGGGKRKKDWDATLRNWTRRNKRPEQKTRTRSAMERNLERNS